MTQQADGQMDAAFERFRTERFGAYAQYPIDAYSYFGAGWKARDAEIDRLTKERDALKSEASELAADLRRAMGESERLRPALDALNELHAYLDFEEPLSEDKPWIFEDYSGINEAFAKAYKAICANRDPEQETRL